MISSWLDWQRIWKLGVPNILDRPDTEEFQRYDLL